MVTTLPGVQPLAGAGDHAALDEMDEGVGEQLGMHAEVAVLGQTPEECTRDRPDAGLDRRPVRDPLGHVRSDPCIDLGRSGRRHLDEGPVDLGPAVHLAHVDLVSSERAGHTGVDLEEERHISDERRDVVAVGAEREVPVAVHR